jgi:hypothetical protein
MAKNKTIKVSAAAAKAAESAGYETEKMGTIPNDVTYIIQPGQHFRFLLPDGTSLHFEQTGDDFSITRSVNGEELVCYSQPTSDSAKASDGADDERKFVSGKG